MSSWIEVLRARRAAGDITEAEYLAAIARQQAARSGLPVPADAAPSPAPPPEPVRALAAPMPEIRGDDSAETTAGMEAAIFADDFPSQARSKSTATDPTFPIADIRSPQAVATLRRIIATNPDASLAAATAKRVAQTDFLVRALVIGPDGPTEEEDAEATALLRGFYRRVMRAWGGGGLEAMMVVGLDSTMSDGAIAFDLDVADTLDDVVDVVPFDPLIVSHRMIVLDRTRRRVAPGIVSTGGKWREVNPLQVFFAGLDPSAGDPHGKPWMLPALDTAPAQQKMRNVLHRVLTHQGWGRLAGTVNAKSVIDSMPASASTPEAKRAHMRAVLRQVTDMFRELEPDDAVAVYDWVKLDVLGAQQNSQGFNPGAVSEVYDIDAAAATKTPPSVLGRSFGANLSSNADVHWWVYALSIESLRGLVLKAIEWAGSQFLRLRGIPAVASVTMSAIRKTDETAEEEAAKTRQDRLIGAMDARLIDPQIAQREMGYPVTEIDPSEEAQGAEAENLRLYLAGYVETMASTGDWAIPIPADWTTATRAAAEPFDPGPGGAASAVELADETFLDEEDGLAASIDWAKWTARAGEEELEQLFEADPMDESPDLGESASRAKRTPTTWLWDGDTFRDAKNPTKALPAARLRRAMESRIRDGNRANMEWTQAMLDGKMTLREWQRGVTGELKMMHLQARMAAVGGRKVMDQRNYGSVGGFMRFDTDHLARFGQQIAARELSPKQILARIQLYASANIRRDFERGQLWTKQAKGYQAEKLVMRGGADHCVGCLADSRLGWQPIGTMKPIGGHECGPNCMCHKEYSKKLPEAEVEAAAAGRAGVLP